MPPGPAPAIRSQNRRRACGSNPVVGSSRNSSSGRPTMPTATSTRRRWPPDSRRSRVPALLGQADCLDDLVRVARAREERANCAPPPAPLPRRGRVPDCGTIPILAPARPGAGGRARCRARGPHRRPAAGAPPGSRPSWSRPVGSEQRDDLPRDAPGRSRLPRSSPGTACAARGPRRPARRQPSYLSSRLPPQGRLPPRCRRSPASRARCYAAPLRQFVCVIASIRPAAGPACVVRQLAMRGHPSG